ncbi:MAG TPA: DUF1318 domain-containing protein [Candidatus Didemnitutus sp.]|nr:DUF1318 domain-containing protein [Candidatus Didemnitutus sp.]
MKIRLLSLFVVLFALIVNASAQPPGELRRQMEARVPAIDRLKTQLIVGEDNQGFLQVVQNGTAEAAQVVAAENADRRVVYADIARQAGSSADEVGRQRAHKIAANSRPGVWIQDAAGRWVKK